MILLLDTSTPVCKVTLVTTTESYEYEWTADRTLADKLLPYLRERLKEHDLTWRDIEGIGAYKGPGSFTGLRIGLTVLNTIADSLHIPIVGATGDGWKEEALQNLSRNKSDELVMPLYGREANITKRRK